MKSLMFTALLVLSYATFANSLATGQIPGGAPADHGGGNDHGGGGDHGGGHDHGGGDDHGGGHDHGGGDDHGGGHDHGGGGWDPYPGPGDHLHYVGNFSVIPALECLHHAPYTDPRSLTNYINQCGMQQEPYLYCDQTRFIDSRFDQGCFDFLMSRESLPQFIHPHQRQTLIDACTTVDYECYRR